MCWSQGFGAHPEFESNVFILLFNCAAMHWILCNVYLILSANQFLNWNLMLILFFLSRNRWWHNASSLPLLKQAAPTAMSSSATSALEPSAQRAVTLTLNLQQGIQMFTGLWMKTTAVFRDMGFKQKRHSDIPYTNPWFNPVSCRVTSSQLSIQGPSLCQTSGAAVCPSSSIATSKEPLKFPYRYKEKRICTDKRMPSMSWASWGKEI